MTILLTGGSGFLGSHVAEQLSRAGRKVKALVRKTSNTKFLEQLPHVELVEGAVDDRQSMLEAARGATAVVHVAGLVKARGPEEFFRVNTEGTLNALDAARAAGPSLRRFVLVSSLAAAGPSDAAGTPVACDAEPRPVTHYGRSKLAAERAALAAKNELPITILRPPAVYGPRDREILALFKALKLGVLPYMGASTNKLSMIYGQDCAAACVSAIDADVPSGATFFLDDGSVYTFEDLILHVERALGKRAWLRFPIPRPVLKTAALASELYGKATNRAVMLTRDKCNELFDQWVCDGSEARESLGWQPQTPFAEGARLTVDWYQKAGWL
jgi:nucleoside-diphosphate-sugar epimerase